MQTDPDYDEPTEPKSRIGELCEQAIREAADPDRMATGLAAYLLREVCGWSYRFVGVAMAPPDFGTPQTLSRKAQRRAKGERRNPAPADVLGEIITRPECAA